MAELIVSNIGTDADAALVVDSRLLASGLNIEHDNFLQTIQKYETQIEKAFGVLLFETGKPSGAAKGGRPQKYALLTEDQATFVITLTRNTPEVVRCKLELVSAFSKAKKILSATPIPQRQLAPQRDLVDYINAFKSIGIDQDPLIRPLLMQRAAEELGGKFLPATRQILVAVRAGELGISQKDIGTGSQLGKYIVACGFEPNGKTPHGRYEVNTFSPSPELDEAILRFFD